MLSLIIWLIVLLIVIYIVKAIVGAMGLPPEVARIVWLVLGLIFLLVLLSGLGLIPGGGYVNFGGRGWRGN